MIRDFSKVDDARSFASVPAGEYECKVVDVRQSLARDGSERQRAR